VQATEDNMAHAHCMLDTWGNKHTHEICNIDYFSTATIFARTCLNITLYSTYTACLVLFYCTCYIFQTFWI